MVSLPPAELLAGYRAAFINPKIGTLGTKVQVSTLWQMWHGDLGVLPHIGSIADEICLIRSLQTDAVNHAPAQILMNTARKQFGRPGIGAGRYTDWV